MKWRGRLLIIIGILLLAAIIFGMTYVVTSKYKMNSYIESIGAVLNAATLVNAEETYTDPERAVITAWEGKRYVIAPENYKALSNYLRTKCVPPLFARVDTKKALHICFCEGADAYVIGDSDGQGANVLLLAGSAKYTMHIAGNELWEKILCVSTVDAENIILE